MENSKIEESFRETIRYMQFRSFLRWYKGTFQDTFYGPFSSGFFYLIAIIITHMGRIVACVEPLPRGVFIVEIILPVFFTVWVMFFTYCSFPYRYTTWLAFVYGITSLIHFFFSALTDMSREEKLFFGRPCEDGAGQWYIVSYIAIEASILLCGSLYSHLLPRIANSYMNSNSFLSSWTLESVDDRWLSVPNWSEYLEHNTPHPLDMTNLKSSLGYNTKGVQISFSAKQPFLDLLLTLCCVKNPLKSAEPISDIEGVTYLGQVDTNGRPHGFGYWKANSFYGEKLVGLWKEGKPCGPYKARQYGTGSGFMCVKIGWVQLKLSKEELVIGCSNVECSVSGYFFRGFPAVSMELPPDAPKNVGLVEAAKKRFNVAGEKFKGVFQRRASDLPMKAGIVDPEMFGQEPQLAASGEIYLPAILSDISDDGSTVPKETLFHEAAVHETSDHLATDNQIPTNETNSTLRNSVPSSLQVPNTGNPVEKKQHIIPASAPDDLQSVTKSLNRRKTFNFFLPSFHLHRRKKGKTAQWRLRASRDLLWCLKQVSPHTPNFGLHLTNELNISIDIHRGMYVAGHVPEKFEGVNGMKKRGKSLFAAEPGTLEIRVVSQKGDGLDPNFNEFPMDEREDYRQAEHLLELIPVGWVPSDAAGHPDVLLYIHGFNNSHSEALQSLGQLVSFGNFPEHLKIFLFTWPSGRSIFEFMKAKSNAEDPLTHTALLNVFIALRDSGIENIHVMCHSMGTRLFLKSFRKIAWSNLFRPIELPPDVSPSVSSPNEENRAGSHSLLPSEKLSDFQHQGLPPKSQSEIVYLTRRLKGSTGLGKSVSGFVANKDESLEQIGVEENSRTIGSSIDSALLNLISVTFLNPEYHLKEFIWQDFPLLHSFCNLVSVFADANDKALWWSEKISGKKSLGKNVFDLKGDTSIDKVEENKRLKLMTTVSFFEGDLNNWLDLDVIDTTFTDQNVSATRHSFWNLNMQVVQDLREILTSRKRARQRKGRLDRREGNVWVYRVAPAHVTTVHE